jgi:hypothetical protein
MIPVLKKTERLAVGGRRYVVRYFEQHTMHGTRRYSAEIALGPADCIILDGDSVANLQARVARLVPATLYSRMLAKRAA